jgi:hypothetical protein
MFDSKQITLLENGLSKKTSVKNSFVSAALKNGAKTLSENFALKYDSTGNDFVDQFGKLGSFKSPRTYAQISSDMSALWSQDPHKTLCFTLYIRTITRTVAFSDNTKTTTVQRGSGLRHEGILRMIWIHINHPEVFWNNIELFISVGSWKDIITMLSYDLEYNNWNGRTLDWKNFGKLILVGLENPNTSNLIKKYLPQIKANSACKTVESQADNMIAKWICSLVFGNKENPSSYKQYRMLKTSGNAHEWQKLISQSKHNLIDFNTVHGRALSLMVSSKYIDNQGLTKTYEEWILSKPIAKYTGYPHELFKNEVKKKYQIDTLNAQFKGLVETAKNGAKANTSMIVVRDTSGSMASPANGTKQSCYDIAKALALFFSEMLPDGPFAESWIEFNSDAKLHKWKGSTPYEKWSNDNSNFVGSTNFQSVIDLFVGLRLEGVAESEFPTGIICISDSEFDFSELDQTNVEVALSKLKSNGFSDEYVSNFKIVLWNLQREFGGDKFETYDENTKNVFYFSGYDGSVIAFLTGTEHQKSEPKNAIELFNAAMDQEVMHKIRI